MLQVSDIGNEIDLELRIVSEATKLGWLSYKLEFVGQRGAPDRMFIRGNRVVFIEFKNPNGRGRVSVNQERILNEIRRHGAEAYVVDDIEYAREILRLNV